MKYMGHKGRILEGIRERVRQFSGQSHALSDAFCGSGVVAWDLAEHFNRPILAGDLQTFATARAAAIVTRSAPITNFRFLDLWILRAKELANDTFEGSRFPAIPGLSRKKDSAAALKAVLGAREYIHGTLARKLGRQRTEWPITMAYGGYFFSPYQAIAIDALRRTLPTQREHAVVALASLIGAASKCSASPGHTAQPFGATKSSLPHIIEAWNRPLIDHIRSEVQDLAPRHAKVSGEVSNGSWNRTVSKLAPGDVVFCDPPYSDVQYSRFYHVLETIARGRHVEVFGTGRNPAFSERPTSEFSRKGSARNEALELIKSASENELRLIITFPTTPQSNGLSADYFVRVARKYFSRVESDVVESTFSSLGGNGKNGQRPAREVRRERIICCS